MPFFVALDVKTDKATGEAGVAWLVLAISG